MLLDTIAIAPSQPGGPAQSQIPQLLALLTRTLEDPESFSVRVWSIRALGKLSEFLEAGEDAEIVSPFRFVLFRKLLIHSLSRRRLSKI
jgi:hypothetical protein